jgi:hypothetical protein
LRSIPGSFTPDTFLGDSAFDAIDICAGLLSESIRKHEYLRSLKPLIAA